MATHDKVTEKLIPDSDIVESVCIENEKDRVQLENGRPGAVAASNKHRPATPEGSSLKDPVV